MAKKYKIAAISDIHSNYVALKAVLCELEKIDPDEIVVAGDNVGLFVQPNQTVEALQKLGARIVFGNSEERLRKYDSGAINQWADYYQMRPLVWTHSKLTDDNLRFLLNLPEQITFSAKDSTIRVVHGTPHSVWELVYMHESEKIAQRLASVEEDILICGHSHQQWHDRVYGTLIVNPGAAGVSYIKCGAAPFSVLTFENGSWDVEEKQVPYSVNEVEETFSKAKIDNFSAWEKMLTRSISDGKITTLAFLKHAKEHAVSEGWDGEGIIPNKHWTEAEETFDWDNYEYIRKGNWP